MIYKYRCIHCGKIPKRGWLYIPSTDDHCDYFYCDNCVPRGCGCNEELNEGINYHSEEAKDPVNYHQLLDEKGRKFPCCEYELVVNEHGIEQKIPLEYIREERNEKNEEGEENEESKKRY